jgi:hypothetical protein
LTKTDIENIPEECVENQTGVGSHVEHGTGRESCVEGKDGNDEDNWPVKVGGERVDKMEKSKAPHKEKLMMDRLGFAIDEACKAGADGLSTPDGDIETRCISVNFDTSPSYIIPWAACYSWEVCAPNIPNPLVSRVLANVPGC